MRPVYQKDGKEGWYFELFQCEFGPYDSEDIAWEKYQEVHSSGCKTCGE